MRDFPPTAPDQPADRIALRDHVVDAEIGAFADERGRRQRLRFTVIAELAPLPAAGDDVDAVVSYDLLVDAVSAALDGPRRDLLESVAEDVAAAVLVAPGVAAVSVRVEKLDRVAGALGVEISRRAAVEAGRHPAGAGGAGRIAVLGAVALADPGLPEALSALAAARAPVLLLPAATTHGPDTADPDARRRIALLALDQAAWQLSGRCPAVAVAASRTELLWGLRHGRLMAWAPARLAAAAEGGARPAATPPADPSALAAWLAATLGLAGVDLVAAEPPAAAPPGLELRRLSVADLAAAVPA